MTKYTLKRIGMAIVTLLVIIIILFCLLKLMPGSPFNNERLTDAQREILEQKYGLDKPLPQQMLIYIKNMFTGNFGVSYSIQPDYPVSKMIFSKLWISIKLGLVAGVSGILVGIVLGIVSAIFHNGVLDTLTTVISMLGTSIPSQVVALGFVYFFAYKLGWFPLTYDQKQPIISMFLPTLALAISPLGIAARFTRNEMLEVMGSEYVTLAETKGVPRRKIIFIHTLKNALVPLITTMAPMVVALMTGSTVLENIFSIPGIGKLFINSIQSNDYNVVLSIAFIFSLMFIVINLLVDLFYGIIDPRISLTGGAKK